MCYERDCGLQEIKEHVEFLQSRHGLNIDIYLA